MSRNRDLQPPWRLECCRDGVDRRCVAQVNDAIDVLGSGLESPRQILPRCRWSGNVPRVLDIKLNRRQQRFRCHNARLLKRVALGDRRLGDIWEHHHERAAVPKNRGILI